MHPQLEKATKRESTGKKADDEEIDEEEEVEEEEEIDLDIESDDAFRVRLLGIEESDMDKRKEEKKESKQIIFKWWLKPSIIYAYSLETICISILGKEILFTTV
ncbi:hypothetical protein WA026_020246 [Henosepilachna vigintioctopunctata]|uniref:Uncharacterized protein n=1 Tax=Henosepilachna vigintioctopunctata TaxID=420089 RepID=A0AAW1TW08_9CUCU